MTLVVSDLPAHVVDGLARVERAQRVQHDGGYRAAPTETLRWGKHGLTKVASLDHLVFVPDMADAHPEQFLLIVGIVAVLLGFGVMVDLANGDALKTALGALLFVGGGYAIARERRLRRIAAAQPRRTGYYVFDDLIAYVSSDAAQVVQRSNVAGFEIDRGGERSKLRAVLHDGERVTLSIPGVVGAFQPALEAWRNDGLSGFTRALSL